MNYFLGCLFSWFEKLIILILNYFLLCLGSENALRVCSVQSKENVFSSSSSVYVNISMFIHQDAIIEETLQFHGWELHIFLLFYLKHILLWKLTLPLWPAMQKILLLYDSFGTIFDSWWSGYFDIYPLYKWFLKEKGKQSWYWFPSFFC